MREMKHRKPLDPSSYLCFNHFSPSPQLLHDLMREIDASVSACSSWSPSPAGAVGPLTGTVR